MPSISQIVAGERSRIIFTIIAENQFKRDLLSDWEAAAGSSGNTVNGYWRIDPFYSSTNNMYTGATNKLLFDTLGFNYNDFVAIEQSDVHDMVFGLKTDWNYERSFDGSLPRTTFDWSAGSISPVPIAVASINGDKQTFLDVLTSINLTYGDVSQVVINSSRTATSEHADYNTAVANAKAASLPQVNATYDGIKSIACATAVPISTSDGRLVVDSLNYHDHLDDAGATVGLATYYDISYTTRTVQNYSPFEKVILYNVSVKTLFEETRSIGTATKLFAPDDYYLNIANNWNTYVTTMIYCPDDYGISVEQRCSENTFLYKSVYSRVVFYLEANVDWLIRNGDHYDIDKVKFMEAPAQEVMNVLQLAMNMWTWMGDGGFWSSTFGGILKMVIFIVVAVVIMFMIMWAAIVGGQLAAGVVALASYGLSVGVGALTGDALLAKAIGMTAVLFTLGVSLSVANQGFLPSGSNMLTQNNASALGEFISFIEPYMHNDNMDSYISPEEQYIEDIDTEETQTAMMYGDLRDETMYYNYNTDIAFKDVYSDYDRIA